MLIIRLKIKTSLKTNEGTRKMFLSKSFIIDQFTLQSKLGNENLLCRLCVRRRQHMRVLRPLIIHNIINVTVKFYFKMSIEHRTYRKQH